jgi:hypothetical protein
MRYFRKKRLVKTVKLLAVLKRHNGKYAPVQRHFQLNDAYIAHISQFIPKDDNSSGFAVCYRQYYKFTSYRYRSYRFLRYHFVYFSELCDMHYCTGACPVRTMIPSANERFWRVPAADGMQVRALWFVITDFIFMFFSTDMILS